MIFNKSLSKEEQNLAERDLEKIHVIRGKILHFASILEYVMLMTIDEELYNLHKSKLDKKRRKVNFSNATLGDKIRIFIEECKKQKFSQIEEFESNIKKVMKYRNVWAHGFVYYHKFVVDPKEKTKKPKNFIVYPNYGKMVLKPIDFETNYFKIANEVFPFVIEWLAQRGIFNDLEKIKFTGLN